MKARERRAKGQELIDNFALGLTHGLMLLAAWRLLSRPDLEDDGAPPVAPKGWLFGKNKKKRADDA